MRWYNCTYTTEPDSIVLRFQLARKPKEKRPHIYIYYSSRSDIELAETLMTQNVHAVRLGLE